MSSNCDKFHEMISAESDGELSVTLQRRLDNHLKECEDCRRYRQLLYGMKAGFVDEKSPVDFRDTMKPHLQKRAWRQNTIQQLAAGLPFVALVISVVLLNNRRAAQQVSLSEAATEVQIQETADVENGGESGVRIEQASAGGIIMFGASSPEYTADTDATPEEAGSVVGAPIVVAEVYLGDESQAVVISDAEDFRQLAEILNSAEYPDSEFDALFESSVRINALDEAVLQIGTYGPDGLSALTDYSWEKFPQGSYEKFMELIENIRQRYWHAITSGTFD